MIIGDAMQRNIDLYPTHTAKFSSFYTYIDDVIIRSPYLHAISSYVYIDEFVTLLTGDLVNKYFMQNLPSIFCLSRRQFALSLTVCQWHASTLMSIPVKAKAYLELVQSVEKRMTNSTRSKSCQLSLASSLCKWDIIKVEGHSTTDISPNYNFNYQRIPCSSEFRERKSVSNRFINLNITMIRIYEVCWWEFVWRQMEGW